VLNAGDDIVQTFEVKPLGVRGRIVRFGASVDDILRQHDYPRTGVGAAGPVGGACALLGSALKFDGKFILQTRSDGPVSMLVADYATPGRCAAMPSSMPPRCKPVGRGAPRFRPASSWGAAISP
jgi:molecular chaperone Hsp33